MQILTVQVPPAFGVWISVTTPPVVFAGRLAIDLVNTGTVAELGANQRMSNWLPLVLPLLVVYVVFMQTGMFTLVFPATPEIPDVGKLVVVQISGLPVVVK